MLLTFEGKGCSECPFQYWRTESWGDEYYCSLSKREIAGMGQLPELDPNSIERPKDCPFAKWPNTLEIQALE